MINKMLVAAVAQSIQDILDEKGVAYKFRDDEEYRMFQKMWDYADPDVKKEEYRQARPAVDRIFSKEAYVFRNEGDPLSIRFNFLDSERELAKDSFGEILLERPDINWRISFSIKSDANVLASMPIADREADRYMGKIVNVSNEIDDFGDQIFGVPCSNEYFQDMNEVLMKIEPLDKETWRRLVTDEEYAYKNLLTPMLSAIAREMPRIFRYHPEAPKKLVDYFYGSLDYYFLKPIKEIGVTRIGCVNSHGNLGMIPDSDNHTTPQVRFPTQLLDVRFATGKYGELSRDAIQFSFDGGWAICLTLRIAQSKELGHYFALNAYLPSTPYGSYRDQVEWLPE